MVAPSVATSVVVLELLAMVVLVAIVIVAAVAHVEITSLPSLVLAIGVSIGR